MRFGEIDFEDEVLDGLYDMNFEEMTPVQEATIPVILEGSDLIACAQTGTGKTAAYTLPLLNKLLVEGNEDNVVKTLVVVPTRELAMQIDTSCRDSPITCPSRRRWSTAAATARLGAAEAGDAARRRRGDRHAGPFDRPLAEQRRRPVAREVFRARRGRPDARHGILRRHHDHRPPAARRAADADVLGYAAAQDRELARQILRKPVEINIAVSKPNEAIEQGPTCSTKRRNWG